VKSSTIRYLFVFLAWAWLGNSSCLVGRSAHGPVRVDVLEPTLRRLSAQHPDTVVGMLLKLSNEPTRQDSTDLVGLGLTVSSVRGTLMTGRARARSAAQLTRMRQVVWIELSMSVPTTPRQEERLARVRQARRK
jgi:hypothetical protein